jgi:hypothetical protein
VIKDARDSWVQPDGVSVSNEMYLVPARSEFQAQFGRDDAAAAVSGIAGDADPHADVILPKKSVTAFPRCRFVRECFDPDAEHRRRQTTP